MSSIIISSAKDILKKIAIKDFICILLQWNYKG